MTPLIAALKFNASLEFFLGPFPVPVVNCFDVGKRSVSFGKHLVQLQRLSNCHLRLREHICWRKCAEITEQGVTIGESSVSKSIAGVYVNGLLEVLECYLHLWRHGLVPKVSAF